MPHMPGHIRDAFLGYLEGDGEPSLNDVVEVGSEMWTVRRLIGKLYHCADILPSHACSQLDIPQGSTYAQVARMFPDFCQSPVL